MVDDAVAVEKRGGTWGCAGVDIDHGAFASLSTRCSDLDDVGAAMSRMQRWSFMVQTVR